MSTWNPVRTIAYSRHRAGVSWRWRMRGGKGALGCGARRARARTARARTAPRCGEWAAGSQSSHKQARALLLPALLSMHTLGMPTLLGCPIGCTPPTRRRPQVPHLASVCSRLSVVADTRLAVL